MTEIVPGLHLIAHRGANMYLLDAGGSGGLVLVDTGFPGSTAAVLATLENLDRRPEDVRDIVCTHAHFDHVGSLAELAGRTGAATWIHRADAEIAETGQGFRSMSPAPGLFCGLLFRLFAKPGRRVAPARIDHRLDDGGTVDRAGGLRVIGTPGHCAGQIALLWNAPGTGRRVLFAGDACMNLLGLTDPVGFEDAAAGRRSQQRLAGLDFDVACFGHGRPIVGGAAARFRRKWG